MGAEKQNKFNKVSSLIFMVFLAFIFNPILGGVVLIIIILLLIKNPKYFKTELVNNLNKITQLANDFKEDTGLSQAAEPEDISATNELTVSNLSLTQASQVKRLEKRKKYLHIALNSTLTEAEEIISQLPKSDRILIEAGTPLIKIYGAKAISQIKKLLPTGTYIVADNKCADLAAREVKIMAEAGANAATCLGVAPIETIASFIEECQKYKIDSIIDMMNVESSLAILKQLKKLPDVVMLHRGVDESEFSKEKNIPYYQIKQIKGNYNILVAVAGGDSIREVQRAIFNDADIVVVWKNFYQLSTDTAQLANSFLAEIK